MAAKVREKGAVTAHVTVIVCFVAGFLLGALWMAAL